MTYLNNSPFFYIYEFPGWNPEEAFPNFVWDKARIHTEALKLQIAYLKLLELLRSLGVADREEISNSMMALEAYHSSRIERSILDQKLVQQALDIYASLSAELAYTAEGNAHIATLVRQALGSDGLRLSDHDMLAQGVAGIALDAVHHYQEPVTQERLHTWHKMLFPSGFAEHEEAGAYRQDMYGRMQVTSGHADPDHRKVSYIAPKADDVPHEMNRLLAWINNPPPNVNPYIVAGITHLMFTAIHPYADGNGRLDRSLTDMMLARADNTNHRYYSLSAEIDRVKSSGYYQQLQSTVRRSPGFIGTKPEIDITDWLQWFLGCVQDAIKHSQGLVHSTIVKQEILSTTTLQLSPDQLKVVTLLIEGGGEVTPNGSKLTADKCGKICGIPTPQAATLLTQLMHAGVLCCSTPEAKKPHFTLPPDRIATLHAI